MPYANPYTLLADTPPYGSKDNGGGTGLKWYVVRVVTLVGLLFWAKTSVVHWVSIALMAIGMRMLIRSGRCLATLYHVGEGYGDDSYRSLKSPIRTVYSLGCFQLATVFTIVMDAHAGAVWLLAAAVVWVYVTTTALTHTTLAWVEAVRRCVRLEQLKQEREARQVDQSQTVLPPQ